MAETQEYTVGNLTSLDNLPDPTKVTQSSGPQLLSDVELQTALANIGVSPETPDTTENPIKERGGILRAFGNAEKKLVARAGLPGYQEPFKQIGGELLEDLSKTDLGDIVDEFSRNFGDRTLTRMLQTTHDIPSGMLARLGTDRSVFEGAVRGLKGTEHVMGSDLFYKGLAAAGIDTEHTEMAWRLRMAKLGLKSDDVLNRFIATANDDELHKLMNPYGLAGSAAGFLLDLGVDGMNWGTLATSLMKRSTTSAVQVNAARILKDSLGVKDAESIITEQSRRASDIALSRNIAKGDREGAMKAAMGDFVRATEATYGSNSPLRRRAMGIVPQVQEELDKVRAGFEVRMADSQETASRIASAGERMRAWIGEKRIEPQLAKAEKEYASASRSFAKATFGGSSLLDDAAKERIAKSYENASIDVQRLRAQKYDFQSKRGNFEDAQDYLRGLIAASPDADLPERAAKEVWSGILGQANGGKLLKAYHGTDFTGDLDPTKTHLGLFFSTDPKIAEHYAKFNNGSVIESIISVGNAADMDAPLSKLLGADENKFLSSLAARMEIKGYKEYAKSVLKPQLPPGPDVDPMSIRLLVDTAADWHGAGQEVLDEVRSYGFDTLVSSVHKDQIVPLSKGQILNSAAAPVQSSIASASYPPAGAAGLEARFRETLRIQDELAHYSMPFTEGRIWAPQQDSWDGAVAIHELGRLARERGNGIAAALDASSPQIHNPAMLQEVGKVLRMSGFPHQYAESVGPELLVSYHQAGNYARIMNDVRAIEGTKVMLAPSDLAFRSQQDAATLAVSAAMRRHINSLRQMNLYGVEVPVGPVEWTTGTGAPSGFGRFSVPSGIEMPGTLPGVKKTTWRDEVLSLGKGTLSKQQVKELRAYDMALREAQLAFAGGSREKILSGMEALFGTHAVLNPDNPVAQLYKANPAMRRMTSHGFQLATPAMLQWRDPFIVFKDTGIAENIFDGTRSLAEGRHHYGTIVDQITKGMNGSELSAVWETMAGTLDPMKLGDVVGPRIRDAAERMRSIFDEGFDLLGVPREKKIVNYLPTILKQNKRMMDAMEAGYVPTELMRDVPVIDRMLRMSDYGTEFQSKFAKLRRGTDAEVEMNIRDVARIYFNSVLRAKFIAPAMEESGQLLRGSILETPRYGEAIRTQGLADLVRNKAQKQVMLDYFEDLERLIHGEPTRFTSDLMKKAAASDPAKMLGLSQDRLTQLATKASSYLTSNAYVTQLAGMVGSAFKNLTQQAVAASEYGPLNYIRNIAGYFAKNDVPEILQNGGIATASGVRKLIGTEMRRVRQDFREIADVASPAGKFARWLNDTIYMGMLQHGENANRGMTWHVGASLASKAGASFYDTLRIAERAANETHFIYGTLGRGPIFQSPITRPFISVLTSYPVKMGGVLAKNFRENPTALARYIFMLGGASNMVQRIGIDPADLVPWGWAPDRLLFFFPEVGLAKLFKGVGGLATHPHDSEEWNRAKRDFLNGILFSGILPIPANLLAQMGQIHGIWADDELRQRSESVQVLPGLNSLVFNHMEPPPSATFGNDLEKSLATFALVMGFGPGASLYAKDMRKTFQTMMQKHDDHVRIAEQMYANYGTFDPAMADNNEMREALADVSPEQKRNIIERMVISSKTRSARALDNLDAAERAQVLKGIDAMIQDPAEKAQLFESHRQTMGLQRRLEELDQRRQERRAAAGQ